MFLVFESKQEKEKLIFNLNNIVKIKIFEAGNEKLIDIYTNGSPETNSLINLKNYKVFLVPDDKDFTFLFR